MKILHTSDWHLGKRLDNFSRMEEQQAVLQEICEIAERENIDASLIAGDLFDSFNPPTEAIDLFYKTLKRLSRNGYNPVIAIAGNHDSPDRIEVPHPLARECGIIFAGYPNTVITPFELDCGLKIMQKDEGFLELQLPGRSEPLRIILTPYANEYRLRACFGQENSDEKLRIVLREKWQKLANCFCDQKGVNILVSHLFMVAKGDKLPEEPDDEKPILHVGGAQPVYTEDVPIQIQYAALGHLHRMHCVDNQPSPAYYSGSPLSYSFAEANQKKYVLIIEAEPGEQATVRKIELTRGKPLIRKRAEGIQEALSWLNEHPDALVELTLVTDSFLTAMEHRQLQSVHPGIVSIIPEVNNAENRFDSNCRQIDLSKSIEELFRDYFIHEKGQEPNDELMNLFTEILAENEQ